MVLTFKRVRRRPAALFAISLLLWLVALAPRVDAADPRAESLFREGRAAITAGDLDRGCQLLASSHRMEARSGTLMTLAYCHHQQGKTASAWAEYREAASLAKAEGRPDYAVTAEERAAAIEPTLSRLAVVVAPPIAPGLKVQIDAKPLPPATYATALPLDPGLHTVVASAPGRRSWSTSVTLGRENDKQRVTVPPLKHDSTTPAGPKPSDPLLLPPLPPVLPQHERTLQTVGIVSTVTGAAAIVIGLALGGVALGHKATVDEQCDAVTRLCSQEGQDASVAGGAMALGSTIAVALGAVGVAGGVVMMVVGADDGDEASRAPEAALLLQPRVGGASMGLRVRF